MDPRCQRAAWAAATAGGVLLTFAPVVVGLRTLSRRDTDRLYAPVRTLVVEALRDGRLPLWNPHEGTGKPLFAEGIHSVLHPVSLLGAALAPSSIDFLILGYLVAAAMGAFLLARSLDASPPASAGAGLAFALSGFSVSMTGNLVFLAGLSTLPWLVAAVGSAGAGSRWGLVATALATACAFFSGDVQISLVGLGLGTLLAAAAGGMRGVARALSGIVPGVLLAGVQIAATAELLPLTDRGLALESWVKTRWPLDPARVLEWIVPGLFRGPLAELSMGASGARLDEQVFSESISLGAPLLVAAALGALKGPRRSRLVFAGAAGVLLWLALGHHLGARQALDWVPVWSRFRYSEKLMAPLALCACALGALGIDALGSDRLARRWTRALTGAACAVAAGLLALLIAPDATARFAFELFGDAGPFYRSTLSKGLPHLLAGLVAVLALDRIRDAARRTAALALLVALAPAAAVFYGAHLGLHDASRLAPAMKLDTDSPVPRLAHPLERAYLPSARQDPFGATARYYSLLLVPAVNVTHHVDSIEPYGAFEPRRLTDLSTVFGSSWARHARRFGLTHVAIPIPHDVSEPEIASRVVEGGTLLRRDEALGFELWAVPHRSWAFFPRRAVAVQRPPHALRPEDPPYALGALLTLLDRGDDDTVAVEAAEPPATAPGRVLGAQRRSERVRIEAESDGPALLVVQDAFWPGWRAAIDGRPTEILAADYLVRAVRWPPGRHRLELTYDPPGVRLGLALSALGASVLLGLAVLAGRARRGRVVTSSKGWPPG